MTALGEPATGELCHALETGNDQAKWVAARALPAQANAAADTCLVDERPARRRRRCAPPPPAGCGSSSAPSASRPSAPGRSCRPLITDPEAKVRTEAVPAVAMFDFAHAIPALAGAGEGPRRRGGGRGARSTTQALRNYRFMNPDKPY